MENTTDNKVKDVKKKTTSKSTEKKSEKNVDESIKETSSSKVKQSGSTASKKTGVKKTTEAKTTTTKKTASQATASKATGSKATASKVDTAKKTTTKTATNKSTASKSTKSKAKTSTAKAKVSDKKTSSNLTNLVEKLNDVKENVDSSKNEEVKEIQKYENEEKNDIEEIVKTDENEKFNTISLKEVREAIENKINNKQKKTIIKEALINLGIAILMIVFLIVIMLGRNNIMVETLDKDMKIITLFILAIGIFLLEVSYKKDSFKIAMNGIEVLAYGAANLCLIYVAKLYSSNLIKCITYIGVAVGGYYIIKTMLITIRNIKKYKNDNNDIKDIIQKKKKIEE